MRSHSGTDEGRNNMRDPTVRDRQGGAEERRPRPTTEMGSHARKTGQKGAERTANLSRCGNNPRPVEREREHELACSRRPAERGFRLAHAFAGTDHPPQDVGQAGAGGVDRRVEAPLRVDLRAAQIHGPGPSSAASGYRGGIPFHGDPRR